MPLPVILETPLALVENGRIHSGFFKNPFRRVNLLSADTMGKALGRPLRWLRLKEWVGFGIDHPGLYGGIIIQNSKYAASGTVYLFEKETQRYSEWLLLDFPARVVIPENLYSSESRIGYPGRSMRFTHELEQAARHTLRIVAKASAEQPSLTIDLVAHQDRRQVEPLVVSLPIAPAHHTYTHKSPLALEGTIRIGERRYDFDPTRDLGNLDEQKTFYPYRAVWKWGCFSTRNEAGQVVALNFVNQMTPEDQPGEDALWVDGKLRLLPRPTIVMESAAGAARIEDPSGSYRLRFTPYGCKAEKRDYGLIAMDYKQLFGHYEGEICEQRIRGAFGALELMKARF